MLNEPSAKIKENAFGVKFTLVRKTVHMRQFAHVSEFAYMKIIRM